MKAFHTTKHKHTHSMQDHSTSQFILSKYKPTNSTKPAKSNSTSKLTNLLHPNKSLRVFTSLHRTRSTATNDLLEPPQRTLHDFKQRSHLTTQHEQLLSLLKATSKEVANHLNLNFFKVQTFNTHSQNLLQDDQPLLYTLFSTLQELDSNILVPLFFQQNTQYVANKDELGQETDQKFETKDRFKLEYIQKFQSIMNEPIAFILKRVAQQDSQIALFIESIWKFIILLHDAMIQWVDDRCQNYVDLEVKNIKNLLNQKINENNRLHDQYHTLQKTTQFQLAVEMTKYQNLMEKYNILQDEFKEFQLNTYEYANLDKAESNMRELRFKIRDMDQAISMVNRVASEERIDVMHKIKNVGQILLNLQEENKPFYYALSKQIRCQTFKESPQVVHPFCYLLEMNTNADRIDAKEELVNFFYYLQKHGDKVKNICEELIRWAGFGKAKQLIDWILENFVDQKVGQFYSKVLGINNNKMMSIRTLRKVLRASGSFVDEDEQAIRLDCVVLDKRVIEEELKIAVEEDEEYELGSVLMEYSKVVERQEEREWEGRSKIWKQLIIKEGIEGPWFHDYQNLWIWKLVMQKYSGCPKRLRRKFDDMRIDDQLKDLDDTFEWISEINRNLNLNEAIDQL